MGSVLIMALHHWYERHQHKQAVQASSSNAGRSVMNNQRMPLHALLITHIRRSFVLLEDRQAFQDYGLGVFSDIFTVLAQQCLDQYELTGIAKQDDRVVWPWVSSLCRSSLPFVDHLFPL